MTETGGYTILHLLTLHIQKPICRFLLKLTTLRREPGTGDLVPSGDRSGRREPGCPLPDNLYEGLIGKIRILPFP